MKYTKTPIFCVVLSIAGRDYKFSSKPYNVETKNGVQIHLEGGLSPFNLIKEVEPFQPVTIPSISVEIKTNLDLSLLYSENQSLDEVEGEISVLKHNEYWENREIYIKGKISIEQKGFLGKPLRIKINGYDPAKNESIWPLETAKISKDTFNDGTTTYDERYEEYNYTTIFGRPGVMTQKQLTSSITSLPLEINIPAFPVYPIDINLASSTYLKEIYYTEYGENDWAPAWTDGNKGFICEGILDPGNNDNLTKGQIIIYTTYTSGGGEELLDSQIADLYYIYDKKGVACTVAKLIANFPNATGSIKRDREYWGAVGIDNKVGGKYKTAGEMIEFLLLKSNIEVDWKKTHSVLSNLNIYNFSGYWNDRCNIWSWLCDNIFKYIPISFVSGPNGIYPVIFRINTEKKDTNAKFIDGKNCIIEGDINSDSSKIETSHSLSYAYGEYAGKYRKDRKWHGGRYRENNVFESTSSYSINSQFKYGKQLGNENLSNNVGFESNLIYSDNDANLILSWMSRVYSEPWKTIRIISDGLYNRNITNLDLGLSVWIISEKYNLDHVAFVKSVGWIGGLAFADLVIFAQP